jgi:hypothetical protein
MCRDVIMKKKVESNEKQTYRYFQGVQLASALLRTRIGNGRGPGCEDDSGQGSGWVGNERKDFS